MIREKLAQMASWLYACESMVYRTVGMMDTALSQIEQEPRDDAQGYRGVRRRVLHH